MEYPFEEGLLYEEDFLCINKILLRKGRYAVLKEAVAYGKETQYAIPMEVEEKTELQNSWYFEIPDNLFWR